MPSVGRKRRPALGWEGHLDRGGPSSAVAQGACEPCSLLRGGEQECDICGVGSWDSRCPSTKELCFTNLAFSLLPVSKARLGLALGSPIFPSGCEGKLGVALESLQGLRDLT